MSATTLASEFDDVPTLIAALNDKLSQMTALRTMIADYDASVIDEDLTSLVDQSIAILQQQIDDGHSLLNDLNVTADAALKHHTAGDAIPDALADALDAVVARSDSFRVRVSGAHTLVDSLTDDAVRAISRANDEDSGDDGIDGEDR